MGAIHVLLCFTFLLATHAEEEVHVGTVRECVPTARPKEFLEIEPVMMNAKSPGYWFMFDDQEAKDYFKKHPSWKYMGKDIFIDSCGGTHELTILRGTTSCDSLGTKLNCGRVTAHWNIEGKMDWAYEHKGENVGQKRWIALQSRLTTTEKPEAIKCEPYEGGLYAIGNVGHNNLGGKGPKNNHPQEIEYLNFLENEGKPIKLVVTSVSDYVPYKTFMNGVQGEFGEIGLLTGKEVKLKFSLKDQNTGNAVTVAGLYFTAYDIDRRDAGEGGEYVDICDADRIITTPTTLLAKSAGTGNGCERFSATVFGDLSDNPTEVLVLNQHQKDKSVTALYENVSSFIISLGTTPMTSDTEAHSRNFFFSGVAPLCLTDSPTALPTVHPTPAPTAEPTLDPTADPTEQPTADPTADPTEQPTADPTEQPTADPTADPTEQPTAATADPTEQPTADPTEQPTAATAEPTVDPTADPTEQPTVDPTADPTEQPTADPTADPTEQPTADPTEEPTADPTVDPTPQPTLRPSPSPTSKPTPMPTFAPTTPPTEEIICISYPVGNFQHVGHNNLGGKGPNTNDPKEIEYLDFMEFEGKTLKITIEAVGEYTPHKPELNGIGVGGEFGMVGIRTDSMAKLKFTLKDQSTNKPVKIPGMYFTVYDLDLASTFKNQGMEYVNICNANDIIETEFSVLTQNKYADNHGCKRYAASTRGTLEDNPTKAAQLTYEQKAKSVTAMYQDISSFTVDLGATAMNSGNHHSRNFLFAAEAPLCTSTVPAAAADTMADIEVGAVSSLEVYSINMILVFALLMMAGITGYYVGTRGNKSKSSSYEQLIDAAGEYNENPNQIEMSYRAI